MRPLVRFRELYSGGRLLVSIIVGGVAFAVARIAMATAIAATLGWVIGVASFLGLTLLAISGATPERMRVRSRGLDARASVIFMLLIAAAVASLIAVGFVLHKPEGGGGPGPAHVIVAFLAILASWLLAHVTFALHYAHSYYGDPGDIKADERGGLDFPGHDSPDYWDFLYYALVVGMTSQVSDVQVLSRDMRRLTLAHGVLSFVFNTGILALAINILASVL